MLKNRYILVLLCALTSSISAWGLTSTIEQLALYNNFDDDNVSWTENHVTFTFHSPSSYRTVQNLYFPDGASATLSWTVDSYYAINVEKVTIRVDRATLPGYVLNIEGKGTSVSASTFSDGTTVESNILNYDATKKVSIQSTNLLVFTTVAIKYITIEYTITPIINTKSGSVPVTICSEEKQTLDLETCITNKQGHLNYHYSVSDANATIEGTSFSATQPGTYKIQVNVDAKDGCHQAASANFDVTVEPVSLTLTAPAASDIYYPHTLETSVLTGGSATVGACEVEGTWAWQNPAIVPNLGNDLPYNVVFTPSTNASCYTNFITVAYVDVVRAQYIYDGSGDGEGDAENIQWGKPDNWQANQTPDIYGEVFIRHDVTITGTVEAYSVTIEDKSPGELSNVTIAPTGSLKVGAGGIKNASITNFMLQAGTSGEEIGQTGALLIDPSSTEPMPNATVEMFSVAYFDMNEGKPDNNAGAYQYVGSPMKEDNVKARDIFTNSWIYNWDEASGEWKNNRRNLILKPFEGYCTSQYSNELGLKIEHKGQLASNANVDLQLSCNGSSAELRGINVFANSYAAPIDITKFELTDFSDGVEATIYLFNTGSKNDIEAREGQAVNVKAKGQFLSIPVKAIPSGYPTVIPAMQGFYVKTTKDHSTVTLNYERLVWNAVSKNTPLHAKRVWEEKNGALCIAVEADGWKDQVFLLESEGYDAAFENGYDAHKLMSGNLNIFALEGEDALAVDATNSIAGTKIAVRTGAETAYTLTFGALSGEAEWSLYDAETKETVDIEEGSQYTFFAEPNTVLADRFQIQERNDMPAITTDLESVGNDAKAHKFIKDGRLFIIKNGLMYNAMGIAVGR